LCGMSARSEKTPLLRGWNCEEAFDDRDFGNVDACGGGMPHRRMLAAGLGFAKAGTATTANGRRHGAMRRERFVLQQPLL
jgi:hypothetical protein